MCMNRPRKRDKLVVHAASRTYKTKKAVSICDTACSASSTSAPCEVQEVETEPHNKIQSSPRIEIYDAQNERFLRDLPQPASFNG